MSFLQGYSSRNNPVEKIVSESIETSRDIGQLLSIPTCLLVSDAWDIDEMIGSHLATLFAICKACALLQRALEDCCDSAAALQAVLGPAAEGKA